MAHGENRTAVVYEIENHAGSPCRLAVEPMMKFAPKEQALTEAKRIWLEGNSVCCEDSRMRITTNGRIEETPLRWELLAYPEDEKDGRPGKGMAGSCCRICLEVPDSGHASFEITFAYVRRSEGEQMLVICNFSREPQSFAAPEEFAGAEVLISNYPDSALQLRPYEAKMLMIRKESKKE